ncbi:NADH-quinone oxidoreductase subunit C [Caulobacter sp. CCUG 60055]|uniref:NADH-quinone oxidoreductase subunit C n=1 Tax=Caulobacter sp. CCUG 60055 TaxID=2100090 RepID=UPI0003C108D0|nr:NADH-quinone oxidoreductase subunit C [Caulobacter sp. CCUG 60055]MBQ1540563.1 NADH-quinone oxidoreductase subunit C [Caulobacteraceae bacterium]MCI3178806.1 NADH-quinone oxidoreductase subunit C [Caulobacter sp. CCUG 60055]
MKWAVSNEALDALGQHIVAVCGGDVVDYKVAYGELTVNARAARIVEVLVRLRDDADCQFQQLVDLAGCDYPQRPLRFDVVYHLLSLTKNHRVRVKVQTDEDTAVPSAVPAYPVADWFEREAFDMYGVFFSGHPDLRRILTDYGFHGHPMRKDFPMTGYVEVRYDDEIKRVVYEPVKSVEFRNWDFLSPWEGAEYVLPGDEKTKEGGQ